MESDIFEPDTEPVQDEAVSYRVDPRLLERAMKRFKGLVRGNGADPETADFVDDETKLTTYKFPARVLVDLDPKYGIRIEAGQNRRAELATSHEDFQRKIQNFVFEVKNTPAKRKQVVDYIFSRPDRGFGLKAQRIQFKTLSHDLVRHEQCMTCSHSGFVACARCRGKGLELCSSCRGGQKIACPKCHGAGRMTVAGGAQAACDQCRGGGHIVCTHCGGRGQTKCRSCGASGKIRCEKCSGTGWLSHLAHIELEAVIRFEFDRETLPPKLVALLESKGPFLVAKGDIEVELKPDERVGHTYADRQYSEEISKNPVTLSYMVTCPYGSVHFQLGERVIPAVILGWQARLIDMPAFLEELTKPGIEAIYEAVASPASAVLHLGNAARYAVWRSLLSQVLQSANLKKSMTVVMNRYSAGLHQETVKKLVIAADQAVRSVTRIPRYIGLGIGQMLFLGICLAYFRLAWGETLFSGFTPPLRDALDFLLVPVGLALGVVGAQIGAFQAQKTAFSGIVDDTVLKGRMPRIGAIWIWASLISVALVAVTGFIL